MKILVVDDEAIAVRSLKAGLEQVNPTIAVSGFTEPADALEYAGENKLDGAFLDIEMRGMNGLALAKKLKDLQPNLGIVFVTAYSQYAIEAFEVRACGYLLKPVDAPQLKRELLYLTNGLPAPAPTQKVRVQTFGGFDLFVKGMPLVFGRSKSKELLAYLVHKRGSSITTKEACSVLWPDLPYDTHRKNYFQHLVVEIRRTLEGAGVPKLLLKSHNSLAIDPTMLDCDSYNFLKGDPLAVNAYRNDYMCSYGWAEFQVGEHMAAK